jgi:hypothetical protein
LGQINKNSSSRGKMSPELHIFQRKSPLVLFESKNKDVKENESNLGKPIRTEPKLFSVSTQTLLYLESSEAETQTVFDNVCVKTCQTDFDFENEQKWPSPPQNFIASIQYHHLTMSKIYQPARLFSPMATLLNAMGNALFRNCRLKIYARKCQG